MSMNAVVGGAIDANKRTGMAVTVHASRRISAVPIANDLNSRRLRARLCARGLAPDMGPAAYQHPLGPPGPERPPRLVLRVWRT